MDTYTAAVTHTLPCGHKLAASCSAPMGAPNAAELAACGGWAALALARWMEQNTPRHRCELVGPGNLNGLTPQGES